MPATGGGHSAPIVHAGNDQGASMKIRHVVAKKVKPGEIFLTGKEKDHGKQVLKTLNKRIKKPIKAKRYL